MKKIALSLAFVSGLAYFNQAKSQTLGLPSLNKFQKIEVTQQSLFKGEVRFDQGLMLWGDAIFQNSINTLGNFDAAREVRFSGLPTIQQPKTGIVAIDEAGNLANMPLGILINELNSRLQSTISNELNSRLQKLDVQGLKVFNKTDLKGGVDIAGGAVIYGDVILNSPVIAEQTFSFRGPILLSGLPSQEEATSTIIGADSTGTLRSIKYESFVKSVGVILAAPLATCVGEENEIDRRASWRSRQNSLFTNECTINPKVGIGTTTPREALEVVGNTFISGGVWAGRSSFSGASHGFSGKVAIGPTTEFLTVGHDNDNVIIESENNKKDVNQSLLINFNTGNDVVIGRPINSVVGARDNKLTILSNRTYFENKVSIGLNVTNSEAKLNIKAGPNEDALLISTGNQQSFKVKSNGITYAREINVTIQNPFPDYVFKKDYKLKSIDEVKAHIQTVGTLPNMPNAKQIETNGADLGEMTRLLTEKVEELTLYIIQLQDRIKQLEKKN